jgi:hypothetical protein
MINISTTPMSPTTHPKEVASVDPELSTVQRSRVKALIARGLSTQEIIEALEILPESLTSVFEEEVPSLTLRILELEKLEERQSRREKLLRLRELEKEKALTEEDEEELSTLSDLESLGELEGVTYLDLQAHYKAKRSIETYDEEDTLRRVRQHALGVLDQTLSGANGAPPSLGQALSALRVVGVSQQPAKPAKEFAKEEKSSQPIQVNVVFDQARMPAPKEINSAGQVLGSDKGAKGTLSVAGLRRLVTSKSK